MKKTRISQKYTQQQNEYWKQIFNSISQPLYVININDYNIVHANKAAGLTNSNGSLTCHAVFRHSSTRCRGVLPCPIEEVKIHKKPVSMEHNYYYKNGNKTNVEIHASPVFDRDGNVARAIIYTFDIADRRWMERELIEAKEQAEAANWFTRPNRQEGREGKRQIAHTELTML